MTTQFRRLLSLLLVLPALLLSAQAGNSKSSSDALDRTNPRAAVTAFLQACQRNNYGLAAQYYLSMSNPQKVPNWLASLKPSSTPTATLMFCA